MKLIATFNFCFASCKVGNSSSMIIAPTAYLLCLNCFIFLCQQRLREELKQTNKNSKSKEKTWKDLKKKLESKLDDEVMFSFIFRLKVAAVLLKVDLMCPVLKPSQKARMFFMFA